MGERPDELDKLRTWFADGRLRAIELDRRNEETVQKLLTSDQKARWKELVGKPLKQTMQ
jgi:hypothetical protein